MDCDDDIRLFRILKRLNRQSVMCSSNVGYGRTCAFRATRPQSRVPFKEAFFCKLRQLAVDPQLVRAVCLDTVVRRHEQLTNKPHPISVFPSRLFTVYGEAYILRAGGCVHPVGAQYRCQGGA